MSSKDKNETESPDIIEEIIPGKNNDYNDKSINQNNNNNQRSFVENYNEEVSAQTVIKASEDSSRTMETSTEGARNQIPYYTQSITDTQEQAAQATKQLAENYLEFQKQALNSFQSAFTPYFENIHNQLLNNQEFFRRVPEMYSRMVSNYTENAIAFSRMCNNIAFSNVGFFKNAINKASK
jgi:hypothetical protein